jgi:hypothetical protein
MAAESIHDEVLGEIVEDKRGRLWTATVTIRGRHSIQIRLIGGPSKTLSIARTLVPWMRENDERARQYAADQLLDLHNEACNEGKSLTEAAFVNRLRLDSAAIFAGGCNLCYRDKRRDWEHIVGVVVDADGKFVRAHTAPTLWKPKGKIHVEPFPPMVLNVVGCVGFWNGKVKLPSWHGFSSRLGGYASVSSAKPSDGTAHLSVTAPGQDKKDPPSQKQASAYRYLLDHDKTVQQAILERIVAAYPGIRDKYGPYTEAADIPEVRQPADLKKLIGLSTVHVLTTAKEGAAYVGFEFGCTWDSEHELGVMTHRDRVIVLGGADTSFLK